MSFKFTDFVGGVRCLRQFDIFGRFGAILLGGEHGKPFCGERQHILKPRTHTVQSCSRQGDLREGTVPGPQSEPSPREQWLYLCNWRTAVTVKVVTTKPEDAQGYHCGGSPNRK